MTAQIGMGGMGEVYRATDLNLKRVVAIKVLPASVSEDPERIARFQREAELLAVLNHPNIAQIHGLEKCDGTTALVMELVDGPTLADRIAQGPIPTDDALAIAKQIAEALDAAHERSIIHRDLKPANVKVREDGTVKVLDFGLAKLADPAGVPRDTSTLATVTSPALLTGAAVILGTAAYMSPEQARGKSLDRRADIWAFGCVLYEMLTGRRAFEGETVTDTLARVLEREPSLDGLATNVRPLLRRCLAKDPRKRLRDIADAMAVLEASDADVRPAARGASRWLWPATAAVFAIVAAVALWGELTPAPEESRVVARFSVPFPASPGNSPFPFGVATSRDGSRLAFVSAGRIHVRSMDQLEATPVSGTENGVFPSFSPNGQSLVFSAPGGMQRISTSGGPAQLIAPQLGGGISIPFWGSDDNILFANASGLFRVSSRGGEVETLASVNADKGESGFQAPQLLPGGKAILFGVIFSQDLTQAVVLNVETKERRVLPEVTGHARFVPSGREPTHGHLLFASGGSLVALPFDVGRLETTGSPEPVVDDMANVGSLSLFDVADNGTLIYFSGPLRSGASNSLVWVDRDGVEQSLSGAPLRPYGFLTLSPDGRKVAVQILRGTLNADIWVYDLDRGTLERRTFSERAFNPVWGPNTLIYREGNGPASMLASMSSTNSTERSIQLTKPGTLRFPTSVSPDGKILVGTEGLGAENQAFLLRLTGNAAASATAPEPFLDKRGAINSLEFSPDGRWVAYQSAETGRPEIYVTPFPGPGGQVQVSLDGGIQPRWARNGRELFFRIGTKMLAVSVETSPTFRALSAPRVLFDYSGGLPGAAWDVAPDGRFLMVKQDAASRAGRQSELHVVTNWFEELQRRAPETRTK